MRTRWPSMINGCELSSAARGSGVLVPSSERSLQERCEAVFARVLGRPRRSKPMSARTRIPTVADLHRYAKLRHDGPDLLACRNALRSRTHATTMNTSEFLAGDPD